MLNITRIPEPIISSYEFYIAWKHLFISNLGIIGYYLRYRRKTEYGE